MFTLFGLCCLHLNPVAYTRHSALIRTKFLENHIKNAIGDSRFYSIVPISPDQVQKSGPSQKTFLRHCLNILFCVSNNYMFQKLTEFPMKFIDIFEMVYGKVCKAPSLLEVVLPLQRNRLVYQRENKLEHFLINDIYLRLPHLPINSNVYEDSWEFGQFL